MNLTSLFAADKEKQRDRKVYERGSAMLKV